MSKLDYTNITYDHVHMHSTDVHSLAHNHNMYTNANIHKDEHAYVITQVKHISTF